MASSWLLMAKYLSMHWISEARGAGGGDKSAETFCGWLGKNNKTIHKRIG